MKEKINKINFFKKIYFSICKIKEYGRLSKEGVKKSTFYIMDLILIFALIYSAILTFKMKNNVNGLQEYLEENFPNLTYEESLLTSESQERTILDSQLVKANFGGKIIIDTKTDYENLIKEYKEHGEPIILLTSNKYLTINSQGVVYEYDYNQIINIENGEQANINKDYFVDLFSDISYLQYFVGYFIGCAIGISIIVNFYNILIAGIAFAFCKIKKIKVKFAEVYSMGLYAHTISVFAYFILNFLPATIGVYVQLLAFIIPAVYLGYSIYINKGIMPQDGK